MCVASCPKRMISETSVKALYVSNWAVYLVVVSIVENILKVKKKVEAEFFGEDPSWCHVGILLSY